MSCARCGGPISRQNGPGGRRKFCATCSPPRERKDRPRKRPLRPVPPPPGATSAPADGMTTATVAELEALGVNPASYLYTLAVLLAERIDAGDGETASGLVALIKAHADVMLDIRSRAPEPEVDLLTELRMRREREQR